ncbi:unnamed protein product [Leptosia nina]|uniref:Uncharacterized protein n=1 Tax=Leptosia nina TaxID=320188 RepID=A0AAV1JV26_9NEOP
MVASMPLHMQLMPMHVQAFPGPMQPELNMQQMFDLQGLRFNPYIMPQPQPKPLIILLPKDNQQKKLGLKKVDGDNEDSVIIDAPEEPKRAIVMLPNGRFSIGDFISSIPWLPIEVNVPDTISWAYNGIASGIAGIISIIGQRLPFQHGNAQNLRTVINDLNLKTDVNPIVLPYNTQIMHLPIEV